MSKRTITGRTPQPPEMQHLQAKSRMIRTPQAPDMEVLAPADFSEIERRIWNAISFKEKYGG